MTGRLDNVANDTANNEKGKKKYFLTRRIFGGPNKRLNGNIDILTIIDDDNDNVLFNVSSINDRIKHISYGWYRARREKVFAYSRFARANFRNDNYVGTFHKNILLDILVMPFCCFSLLFAQSVHNNAWPSRMKIPEQRNRDAKLYVKVRKLKINPNMECARDK